MSRIPKTLKLFLLASVIVFFLYSWSSSSDSLLLSSSKATDCLPKRKIGFLKIHKCASSTIQNIFMRYAYGHNINVAVPPETDENYLGNPKHFSKEMLRNSPGRSFGFEMFLLHTRWDHAEVSKVLGQGAFYVTMLRNPVDLFESLFSYGNLQEMYGTSLEGLIEELRNGSLLLKHRMRLNGRYGWNQISWDFGIHPNHFERPEIIKQQIASIEKNFHLVMIAERMEESLILLKNALCWPLQAVTTLKLNARKEDARQNLTTDQRKILEKWLAADMMIYEHFSRKFEAEIQKIRDDKLRVDVNKLNSLNAQLTKDCISAVLTQGQIKNKADKPFSDKAVAFQLRDNYKCRLLGMKENNFLNVLRIIQAHREYTSSLFNETQGSSVSV